MKETTVKIPCRVSQMAYIKLKRLADARGETLTKVAGLCLTAYLQDRADAAEVTAEEEQPVSGAQIAHLEGIEQRLTATLNQQGSRHVEILQEFKRTQIMIEKFTLSYLQHTPEIPEARKGLAAESGQQRFDKWSAAVRDAIKGGQK